MENYSYNSSYPESGDSSPRSREIEFENPPPWEDSQNNQPPANYKVKFMCSYGGKIHPRPNDNQLSYIGGETKILSVDRNLKFNSLLSKLIALCDSDNISFKYQLPGEDLDALISVTNDDDLEHMMHEYERLSRVSPKPARLRIFIFQTLSPSLNSSTRSFGSDEVKSEKERFVEALNSAPIMTTPPQSASPVAAPQPHLPPGNVDFLFGLEKANAMAAAAQAPPQQQQQQQMVGRVPEMEDPVVDERFMGMDPIHKHIQDLQRLRLEEQQGIYRRKSEDSLTGGFTGGGGGEYYRMPEKISQMQVPGGVTYWTDKSPVTGGVYPPNTVHNEQPVYMVPNPATAYHQQMVRPVTGAPNQGYYTVQRIPTEVYRDQPQMYNMIPPSMGAPPPTLPQQKATGYSEGYGMVRPGSTGGGGVGMVTEAGYPQMAYDGGMGRQVIYNAPGGVMGAPAPGPVQTAAQYQAMAAAMGADHMRQGGPLNPESGGKVVTKVTQASV
ncbi:hypothetical protein BUALT_Bualt15G0057100 [Buddleja alternifolia]|uniref:PB1 domain-containing protein n=1 Tax=Buddleja alternifolia TaxID=168488 RepID=A0AAV6WCZ1_9LAMI|nr:hypothetical protein BUALT_Bualt15G0057100 [Buddleja alternifolia]